jgi:putative aldouronate transport system substrate-binding protein
MKKFVVLLIAIAMLLSVSACAPATPAAKIVITVGLAPSAMLGDADTLAKFEKVWEKAAGDKYTIKVQAVTGDDFPTAMLQNFATGQGFDIYEHWTPADCYMAGITTDITKYVQNWTEYKNGKLNKTTFDKWMMGKSFRLLPKEEGWKLALIYRKDWLTKLNMAPPTTLDEFKTVAYAMAQKDPDGNGKDDTYGLCIESDSTWNGANLFYAFGSDNYFDMTSSGYSTDKGYLKNDALLKLLTFYRDLNKDKVLDPNSFNAPIVQADFEAGKTGMFFMDTAWIASELDEKIGADNWGVVPVFNILHNGGGALGISTVAEKKGTAQMNAAWEVLKAWYAPEMQLTLAFGFEGEGWSKDGSTYKYIKMTEKGGNITGNLRTDMNFYKMSGVDKDPKQAYHSDTSLTLSGGHMLFVQNRYKIEKKMDGLNAAVAMGEKTPEAAIAELNAFVDAAFKEVNLP